jgi:LPS-assembly protein
MTELLRLKYFYVIFLSCVVLIILSSNKISADQKIRITADEVKVDNNSGTIEASGNAIAQDEKGVKIKSDIIIYDEKQSFIKAKGNTILNDIEGNTYFFDKLESDSEMVNLQGSKIRARLEDGSRVVGSNMVKRGNISSLKDAEYTPCLENDYLIKNCPGWKLKAKKIYQNTETKTIHYDHARIHLFNVPVFYVPYFSHPDPSVKKRSGFLMPTVETDQNLGDTFSIPIFYNIRSNLDFTFTPTIQSESNNFYSLNYRLLNDIGKFIIDGSIDDDDDDTGTSHHLFLNSQLNNPYGTLDAFVQSSNNDTYMRKNKINKLTVLKTGLSFERSNEEYFFSMDTIGYKHLAIQDGEQWEYVYPRITYNVNNIDTNFLKGNITLNNQFYTNKNLNNDYTTLASSQINWYKNYTNNNSGLLFENRANLRMVSISQDNNNSEDSNNVRFYPQFHSIISYPLIKTSLSNNQTLTPILMPILAPYNNYTDAQNISSSNLFSSNRATSITKWESGPRVNYGIDWLIDDNKDLSVKLTLGQSFRLNKNNTDTAEELSDYYFSANASFKKNYLSNSIVLDRKNIDIKSISMNTYSEIYDLKLKIDYDYTSGKYASINEQIAIGGEYNFRDNFYLKFTGTKDIDTNKNIGYQYGLLYEDNCLGIDLNYYRDMTIDRDIKESDGYSFTIVLKPFGSTRSYGKSKVFGPLID